MTSKVDIRSFFGISQSYYLSVSTEKKSKMVRGYYKNLLVVYFGDGKKSFFVVVTVSGLMTERNKIA